MGTVICDLDGKINDINPAAKRMLGLKADYLGKSLFEFDSDIAKSINDLEVGIPEMISINGIDKYKCQVSEVIHQGFKRKFIMIDDLSTEILQSEKEAFGRIIRMMAHEVNNSMGAVNSILDTVIEYGFTDDKDPELKSSLTIAVERNESLSKFMANYASILRLPEASVQPLDLNRLLKKCGQLFTPIASSHDISINYDLKPQQVTISADPILLEQVISNIIKNAIESIVEDGDIIISTKLNPFGFAIIDNGVGVAENDKSKLFTPFFSTKPTGQGVGLMLIRDILIKHNADFSLKTDQESGLTSFLVSF
jgi:signal transduction histidine kinase